MVTVTGWGVVPRYSYFTFMNLHHLMPGLESAVLVLELRIPEPETFFLVIPPLQIASKQEDILLNIPLN